MLSAGLTGWECLVKLDVREGDGGRGRKEVCPFRSRYPLLDALYLHLCGLLEQRYSRRFKTGEDFPRQSNSLCSVRWQWCAVRYNVIAHLLIPRAGTRCRVYSVLTTFSFHFEETWEFLYWTYCCKVCPAYAGGTNSSCMSFAALCVSLGLVTSASLTEGFFWCLTWVRNVSCQLNAQGAAWGKARAPLYFEGLKLGKNQLDKLHYFVFCCSGS